MNLTRWIKCVEKRMKKATPNAKLTSPPPVGFDNKLDYGGGSG